MFTYRKHTYTYTHACAHMWIKVAGLRFEPQISYMETNILLIGQSYNNGVNKITYIPFVGSNWINLVKNLNAILSQNNILVARLELNITQIQITPDLYLNIQVKVGLGLTDWVWFASFFWECHWLELMKIEIVDLYIILSSLTAPWFVFSTLFYWRF